MSSSKPLASSCRALPAHGRQALHVLRSEVHRPRFEEVQGSHAHGRVPAQRVQHRGLVLVLRLQLRTVRLQGAELRQGRLAAYAVS